MKLIGQANSAMAPLIPIYNIIDTVIALFNCVKAIPDALGPPPDPSKLAECIPNLVDKIEELLGLIPLASLPLLIISIIDALIAFLEGIKDQIQALIVHLADVATAATRAEQLGDAKLLLLVQCAEEKVDSQIQVINQSVAPINKTVALLNVFLSLIGLPEIPDFGELIVSGDLGGSIAPIDETIETLIAVRDSIPIP